MSDKEELLQEVVRLLVGGCPLNKVRKKEKPCPFFGTSGDCNTCTHNWHIIVNRIFDAVGAKKLGCQKTMERVRELEAEVEALKSELDNATISSLGDLWVVMVEIWIKLARGALDRVSSGLDSIEEAFVK